jgi:penicillin-binding protein 2
MLGGIGYRLFYLQMTEGERHLTLAENNRIRVIPKLPIRGNILDRKGRLLASSRLTYSVFLWPTAPRQPNWLKTLKHLTKILKMPEAEILQRLKEGGYGSTARMRIARNLTPAQVTALAEYGSDTDGVEVDIESVRHYPNKELAAHALGYTGEMSQRELGLRRGEKYRLGDFVGQMGVEAAFEKQLRGEWGGLQVEVDGSGKVLRPLGVKLSQPGKDVYLTLDLDVQKAAEAALGNRKGAIVAMNPKNGAILAMVSRPTFDPNIFSSRIAPAIWRKVQSQDHPFVNRALRGFPPASTFKIITATAGMESGKFSPNVILPTYGAMNIGGVVFGEWNHAGFGPLGFVGGLQWSSDTFFYQIGRGIGGPTLIEWTRRYGLGQKTGIELEQEESNGLVADEVWKWKRLREPWSIGDTINMSIGQGFLQATPLQVAVMFSVPANGGYRVKPHLLEEDRESKKWRESLNLKPATIRVLRQGLRAVVSSGTGRALDSPTVPPAAGKSGTAEAPPGPNHIWFGGYAPADKPEIVVVAFGDHEGDDGGGGKIAAPMVLQVMEAYFKGNKSVKPATDKPKADPSINPNRARSHG